MSTLQLSRRGFLKATGVLIVGFSTANSLTTRGASTAPGAQIAPGAPASRLDSWLAIAEDNTVNQRLVKRMIENMGGTVDIAADGREAVTFAG